VSAQRPIDVAGDISIAGTPTHRPTGHYLLLSIHAYRPNLAGFLGAAFRGDPTVSAGAAPVTAADRALATRIGRQQFADSQRDAVASAAAIAGVDARRIRVRFRERNLVGPSAGLVYALAIADMLTGRDLIGGRTVAATGAIEPSGKLDPVGWVGVKASGAAGRASVLLVPAGEQADAFPWVAATYGVADLHEAIAVLQQTGPVKPST
jgi:PDZ domain-containing protein